MTMMAKRTKASPSLIAFVSQASAPVPVPLNLSTEESGG